MKKPFNYLLVLFVLSGFTSAKQEAEPKSTDYIKEIPFNFDYGLPIIKATINNIEYDFLFDTGMPNALSDKLTNKLGLKSIRSASGSDVNGNTSQESYVIIDEIKVGGISFENIETLSVDLSSGFEIGCLNLDGVIGNNLIRTAIWEIDYENKVIRLTDNIEKFKIPDSAEILKFKTNTKNKYYSPSVDIKINNKKRKGVKFDTGSTGGITMPLNFFSNVLDPNKSVEYFGKASAALYGKGENIKYVDSKIESIELGDLTFKDQIVTFSENFPVIGNKLFKNYKLIIDYSTSKIYLIKQKEYNNSTLDNFGHQIAIIDQKAIVSLIYKNSEAEKMGLQLGDEILKANDLNYRELLATDACGFLFDNPHKKMESLDVLVLRDGKEIPLKLKKKVL